MYVNLCVKLFAKSVGKITTGLNNTRYICVQSTNEHIIK
jgi:hypothetical protein